MHRHVMLIKRFSVTRVPYGAAASKVMFHSKVHSCQKRSTVVRLLLFVVCRLFQDVSFGTED